MGPTQRVFLTVNIEVRVTFTLRCRQYYDGVFHSFFSYRLPIRGFDTSLGFLQPEACGVLRGDTGYLTPEDLDEVDKVCNLGCC